MTGAAPIKQTDIALTDAVSEDELFRAFFGPNSGKFEKILHQMRDGNPAGIRPILSWCWPAFFLTVPWFFYRKMYVWGIGIVALLTALDWMTGRSSPGGYAAAFMIMTVQAKFLYIHHADRKLKRLRATYANDAELLIHAKEQGGVSILSAVVGTVLTIGGSILVIELIS